MNEIIEIDIWMQKNDPVIVSFLHLAQSFVVLGVMPTSKIMADNQI